MMADADPPAFIVKAREVLLELLARKSSAPEGVSSCMYAQSDQVYFKTTGISLPITPDI